MKTMRIAGRAAAALAALAAAALASETVLNIAPASDVRGPNVLLRDLVAVQDDLPGDWRQRPVLPAPEPGKSRDIPLASIAYALQQYPDMHHVVLRGTSQTRVRRTESALDGEPIALEVQRHIRETPPWKDTPVEVSCEPPARLTRLPEGRPVIRVQGYREDIRAPHQYLFDVAIEVDGAVVRTVQVPARILPVREVWVAARTLAPGQILVEDDVTAVALPVETHGGGRVPALEPVAGLEIARTVKAGQPLQRQHLLPRLCATRGDTIAVTASSEGISVTLSARALSSGRLGDVITCENVSSKRRVLVRLTNPKEATTEITPSGRTTP
jgi:flagella basal body P-ring formation protein FlgA